MIEKIIEFARDAGLLALKNQKEIGINFKGQNVGSVVTETDIEISRRFRKFIKDNFSNLNHIIIDEESFAELSDDKFSIIANSEYQFVLDPIDGTHTYASNTPYYGISIGVMKNCKPYIGVVYLPSLKEMVIYDGEKIRHISDINDITENETIIEPKNLDKMAFIFDNPWFVKINDNYDKRKDTILNLYACVVHFFYLATNRAKGYYFGAYLWDMAASWPIMNALGFEFINYNTKEIMKNFSAQNFNEKFQIKDIHVVCKPEDFELLKSIADIR